MMKNIYTYTECCKKMVHTKVERVKIKRFRNINVGNVCNQYFGNRVVSVWPLPNIVKRRMWPTNDKTWSRWASDPDGTDH